MTTVEQLIGDLLLRHNCVIVPSFGGFVAKPVSARIDYNKGSILPPGKSLLFNRQLVNNDGLVANEYSHKNGVSFNEAMEVVRDKVNDWNTQLSSGGRVEIDRVGNLYFDEERNICFEQDRFFNLLLESFGLGGVHFLPEEDVRIVERKIETQPVVEQKQNTLKVENLPSTKRLEEQETPVISIAPIRKTQKKKENRPKINAAKQKRRPWKYVAAACILPIAFYSVWIPMKTDVLESGVISVHDFNPFHKYSDASYVKEELGKNLIFSAETRKSIREQLDELNQDTEYYTYKFDEDTYIKVAVDSEVDVENETVSETPETIESTDFEANVIHYIVGCFGNKSNAENLVAKLKANGLDAKIVDVKNGLHRVSAGGAISNESYEQIKLKADALGFSGWKLL